MQLVQRIFYVLTAAGIIFFCAGLHQAIALGHYTFNIPTLRTS